MKNTPDTTAAHEAVRVAALKVAKTRRIAEAEDRIARAAKLRYKSAKKSWKVARKTVKRTVKRLELAERNLLALQKQLKRCLKKSAAKPVIALSPGKPKSIAKSTRKRKRSPRPKPPTITIEPPLAAAGVA